MTNYAQGGAIPARPPSEDLVPIVCSSGYMLNARQVEALRDAGLTEADLPALAVALRG
jgi:hypothetical protein